MSNRQREVVADMMRRSSTAVSRCVNRIMHRDISITLSGAVSSTLPCTNQQFCYCSERDAHVWSKRWPHRLNFVLANQQAYRPSLSLPASMDKLLVVRGVIEAGYQHISLCFCQETFSIIQPYMSFVCSYSFNWHRQIPKYSVYPFSLITNRVGFGVFKFLTIMAVKVFYLLFKGC